jgi:hypothetical protein
MFKWRTAAGGPGAGNRIKPGSVAGTAASPNCWVIGIDGSLYKASDLAHLYLHGEWPAGSKYEGIASVVR